MSLGVVNVVGSVGKPMVPDAASVARERLDMMPAPGQVASGQPKPAASVEQTEMRVAVQATPASAKAMKVDLTTDETVSGELPEYPVFGPDKFARVAAEKSQAAAEEAAQDAADLADTPEMALVDEVPVSEAGDAAPVKSEDAEPDQSAQSVTGVSEQPAQASEADLTA